MVPAVQLQPGAINMDLLNRWILVGLHGGNARLFLNKLNLLDANFELVLLVHVLSA